jgi:hypothetical protein
MLSRLHLQFIPENIRSLRVYSGEITNTLLGISTPQSTSQIKFGVEDRLAAFRASGFHIGFPKLYNRTTVWALMLEDILWFPVAPVLTGTFGGKHFNHLVLLTIYLLPTLLVIFYHLLSSLSRKKSGVVFNL